jgi:Universal stress protein family
MGASNKYSADEQLDQIAFYWINMHDGQLVPLTVRILSRDRDVHLDLGGGNRIPRISERRARSVAELRAAGVGVQRVLLAHDGSPESSDLFEAVLTMLDPQVVLGMVHFTPDSAAESERWPNGNGFWQQDQERARQLGRKLEMHKLAGDQGPEFVRLAREGKFDLIILALTAQISPARKQPIDERTCFILRHAHCRVFLAAPPSIPQDVEQ